MMRSSSKSQKFLTIHSQIILLQIALFIAPAKKIKVLKPLCQFLDHVNSQPHQQMVSSFKIELSHLSLTKIIEHKVTRKIFAKLKNFNSAIKIKKIMLVETYHIIYQLKKIKDHNNINNNSIICTQVTLPNI